MLSCEKGRAGATHREACSSKGAAARTPKLTAHRKLTRAAQARACVWLFTSPLASLFLAFPLQLYHTTAHQEDLPAALDEPPVLVCPDRPSQEQQIEALNAALAEGLRQERAAKAAERRPWL